MDLSEAMRLRLENLLEVNKLNGNKLALSAGISRSSINKFLRKQSGTIRIETITLICQSLGITLKEFFDDKLFDDVEIND